MVDLDPVGVAAERFTLVHLMTMNMMVNRTTAMAIGTAMAAALLFSETRKISLIPLITPGLIFLRKGF